MECWHLTEFWHFDSETILGNILYSRLHDIAVAECQYLDLIKWRLYKYCNIFFTVIVSVWSFKINVNFKILSINTECYSWKVIKCGDNYFFFTGLLWYCQLKYFVICMRIFPVKLVSVSRYEDYRVLLLESFTLANKEFYNSPLHHWNIFLKIHHNCFHTLK